jgi:hypothetical protein
MTEQEFWVFLERRGKIQMLSRNIAIDDHEIDTAAGFINCHALLPKDYDNVSEEEIVNLGDLLFQNNLKQKTKEAILILLAHQVSDMAMAILTKFNLMPDEGLKVFARFALEESLIWNE